MGEYIPVTLPSISPIKTPPPLHLHMEVFFLTFLVCIFSVLLRKAMYGLFPLAVPSLRSCFTVGRSGRPCDSEKRNLNIVPSTKNSKILNSKVTKELVVQISKVEKINKEIDRDTPLKESNCKIFSMAQSYILKPPPPLGVQLRDVLL